MLMRGMCGVFVATAIAAAGSCRPTSSGSIIDVPELGLTMALPAGWVSDPQNPRMFYDREKSDANLGMIEDYPLEGKALAEYVDAVQPAMGAKFLSKTPVKVGEYNAFEIVSEAADTKIIEVNIEKNDRVIRISFRALTEDFSDYEAAMRDALRGIVIR